MTRNAWSPATLTPLLCLLAACGSDGGDKPDPDPNAKVVLVWRGEATEYCKAGILLLQADVQGASPDEVELLRDGQRVTVFTPPYQFQVNCDQELENAYKFQMRAKLGSRFFPSQVKTLVVDRTAPSVQTTSPNISTNIRKDSPIFFEFSEPVKGNPTPTTSLYADSMPVAHTASLSEDGRRVTLVPAQPLRAPAQYEATFYGGGLTDAAGHALKESSVKISWYVLPFARTGAPVERVTDTAIARGPSGTPWMAIRSSDTHNITVRQWTAEGWKDFGSEAPGSISGSRLALAVPPSGELIVASLEERSGEHAFVRVLRWSNGAWRQVGGNLDANPAEDFIQWVSVAADSQGNPTVVWHENSALHVRRWTGTTWEALGPPIGRLGDNTESPVVAVDSQNRVVLAYSQEVPDSSYERVFVQRWEGSGWAAVGASLASTNVFSITDVDLTIGPGDAPAVAWIEGGSDYEVFAARWEAGTWQSSSSLGTSYLRDVSIAADANGRLIVAWWDEGLFQQFRQRLVYTARFAHGAWSKDGLACQGDDPKVTFTAEGTALLWVVTGNNTYRTLIDH
jgi:hypothetical protein